MVPPLLQLPLGDTIGIIADTDFYQQWLNLVPVFPYFDRADSGHHREVQPHRFSHYKRDVTNCPLCLQTVASKIPYRRVVFRNKIRSGTFLQAIPRSLPGYRPSTIVADVYSKSTI